MRRVFRTRTFTRWMRKAGVTDDALFRAVSEMIAGLVDADLGGGVFKKRVPISGRGKRSGARTIVATKSSDRWFFLYGFSKNEKENIDSEELKAIQKHASDLLQLSEAHLRIASETGQLVEIYDGNSKKQDS